MTAVARRAAVTALLACLAVAAAAAQTRGVWLGRSGGTVHVRGSRLGIIAGAPLARLKDGRSVVLHLELALAAAEPGPYTVHAQRRFVLSYDLWEERFAIARRDPPLRSISHLSVQDAEAWCLDQLAVATDALPRAGVRLWIRLVYRFDDEDSSTTPSEDTGAMLRGLIDRLSRRGSSSAWSGTIVSGPVLLD